MLKSIKYLFFALLVINLTSCTNTNNNIVIKFSPDSNLIILNKIDKKSIYQVKNDLKQNLDSSNLVSVVCIPGELDSLQDEETISGKLTLAGDSLIFAPDKPFLKGKSYLVESYLGTSFADRNKLFKGTIKHNLKPQTQLLKR
ncbi:hypothetical protein [Pedobacter sp. Leaf132]|uniref:hypothetical protein n=1 Tax=Pedobacter sp. Leaf132 TaxID=2876557 RepID=UPI001E4FCB40|nr:hypothetical protein [Pedobacter sp. Leaf132]